MLELSQRPTKREIDKRLKEARQALLKEQTAFANPAKAVGELMELGVGDTEEMWTLILDLLEEIEIDNYVGSNPPQKSYERTITDCELWAFDWDSTLLKKRMYLKFAIKKESFYYLSLHESKTSKDG